jgi:hypothetical protein
MRADNFQFAAAIRRRWALTAAIIAFPLQVSAAVNYYVATNGSNSNPGTLQQPWRTIQKAANVALPGSVVYVRGGVYQERVTVKVSGSAAQGYITFRNYPGEKPIVDGSGQSVPDAPNGLFLLAGRRYVAVQGFELRNYKTATLTRVPAGIYIRGASHHIRIRNNKIHHIEHNGSVAHDVDAHGIAVYGDNAAAAIHHLLIQGNELYALKLGSSEALVVNGNVNGFQIIGNKVHDNNNIGIELASEHKGKSTRNIIVRNNFVYLNDIVGITLGGYDKLRGSTQNCAIVNNTLLRNDRLQWGNGELLLQYDTRNNVIKNNIFQANTQNLLIANPFSENTGNVVDSNLYFTAAGNPANAKWQWRKQWYRGFETYRAATGNDTQALFADPLLASSVAPVDLHIQVSSPAIDRGEALEAAGQFDIDSQPRLQGLMIDIGADEAF